MNERYLEDLTARLLENAVTSRLLEVPDIAPPPPPPSTTGITPRRLEDGTGRLLEDAVTSRLLESLGAQAPSVPVRPIRIALGPAAGSAPTFELGDYDAARFSSTDAGQTLTVTMSGTAPSAAGIVELATDVWIYRQGEPWQRLRVVSVDQEWGEDGSSTLSFTASSYLALLQRRWLHTDLSFIGVAQGDVAWALIDHTQTQPGGDLGITAGTLSPRLRNRQYQAGECIGVLLGQLAAVIGGPRMTIGPDLVFHAYAAGAERSHLMPVLLGTTVSRLRRPSGAAAFANVVRGTGDAQRTQPVLVEASPGTDPRGRWEAVRSWPTVVQQATLQDLADGAVQSSQTPAASWTATLDAARWLDDLPVDVTDRVVVVVPRSAATTVGVPTVFRDAAVVELIVDVAPDGALGVQVGMVEL